MPSTDSGANVAVLVARARGRLAQLHAPAQTRAQTQTWAPAARTTPGARECSPRVPLRWVESLRAQSAARAPADVRAELRAAWETPECAEARAALRGDVVRALESEFARRKLAFLDTHRDRLASAAHDEDDGAMWATLAIAELAAFANSAADAAEAVRAARSPPTHADVRSTTRV